MEYGGHFGEPSTSFIASEKIDNMIDLARPMRYSGEWQAAYIISVDPASSGDTYVVSWGFTEGTQTIVDGIVGFRPTTVLNPVTDKVITVPVQADDVTAFILTLSERLAHRGTLLEVVFDQWNSSASITRLRNAGIVAVETFFTNKYKNEMYTNFLEKLNQGAVRVFGLPPQSQPQGCPEYKAGWLDQMKLELKYLTKTISGGTVKYAAPTSGPIQTDDYADSIANLTHRLALYSSGDRQIYKDLFKQTGRPIQRENGLKISRSGGFFRSPAGARSQSAVVIKSRLGDRIGRKR